MLAESRRFSAGQAGLSALSWPICQLALRHTLTIQHLGQLIGVGEGVEASERVKALEGLQQLLDGITSASLEDRLALFKRTFDALQTLLGDCGSEQPDAAAAVRSAAFQLLGKVQLAAAVSRSGEHFDHFRQLVANYFDLVFKATSTENEENALICVKALQQLFRTIRSVLLQMPDANMGFDAMLERVVDDFTEVLSAHLDPCKLMSKAFSPATGTSAHLLYDPSACWPRLRFGGTGACAIQPFSDAHTHAHAEARPRGRHVAAPAGGEPGGGQGGGRGARQRQRRVLGRPRRHGAQRHLPQGPLRARHVRYDVDLLHDLDT